jgi:uncharacterized damage-inducible protein DinB
MAEPATEAYLYLMRRAFDQGEHSFVRNLESTSTHDWDALIPGQLFGRSIGYTAWHNAAGKQLYWDHAFGRQTLTGDITGEGVLEPRRTLADVLEHARRWHERWLESVAALTQADLEAPTTTHWGQVVSMRWVIVAVIEHDLYHAGEINHLRAVLQGNDYAPGFRPG